MFAKPFKCICLSNSTKYKQTKRFAKVRSIFVSYFIRMRFNVNGSIFCTKMEKSILKKLNSMKCLVSVTFFFTSTNSINVKSHMYQVTN